MKLLSYNLSEIDNLQINKTINYERINLLSFRCLSVCDKINRNCKLTSVHIIHRFPLQQFPVGTLKYSDITSKFRSIAMFIIVYL